MVKVNQLITHKNFNYKWLADSNRNKNEFPNLEFAVYGLGNSQYEFFNAMGREVHQFLELYGGTRVFTRGEGDDDIGSIEAQFSEWKQKLYQMLCDKYFCISNIK
eukprot:119213_1